MANRELKVIVESSVDFPTQNLSFNTLSIALDILMQSIQKKCKLISLDDPIYDFYIEEIIDEDKINRVYINVKARSKTEEELMCDKL